MANATAVDNTFLSFVFRPATSADIPAFLEMIGRIDDPTHLIGPGRSGASVPNDDYFSTALRSPAGPLGYRYTTVIQLEGRVAGFAVMMPLERLEGLLLGPLLPMDVAKARYGDLAGVIDVHLIVVDPALREIRPSIPLVRWCLAEARRLGYRYVISQRWDRHVRSARFFEKYSGMRPFHKVEARFDEDIVDAFTFIDRGLDDVEVPA